MDLIKLTIIRLLMEDSSLKDLNLFRCLYSDLNE